MFESSNIAVSAFEKNYSSDRSFTVTGAAIKSLILLICTIVAFGFSWHASTTDYAYAFANMQEGATSIPMSSMSITMTIVGALGGFIVGMIIIYNQHLAPYLAPIYASLEGIALGALSAMMEAKYPGIVMQTTFGVMATGITMLLLYSTGLVRPTPNFVTGLVIAMTGILCLYFTDIILSLFGVRMGWLHDGGIITMIVQGIIVIVAACCFIVDFGEIAEAAESNAPKSAEWYAGFSLLVTIVWLYIEVMKLIAAARSDD